MNATLRVLPISHESEHAAHGERPLPWAPFHGHLDLGMSGHSLKTLGVGTNAHDAISGRPCPKESTREIPLVITAKFPYIQKGFRINDAPAGYADTGVWLVNNNSWVDPSAPLYLTKGACRPFFFLRSLERSQGVPPSATLRLVTAGVRCRTARALVKIFVGSGGCPV